MQDASAGGTRHLADGRSPRSSADLLARLDALGIEHRTVRHRPVFTVAEAKAVRGQLDGAHAYAGATACGPGADAWEDDDTYLQGLPWYRSPSEAIEHTFSVCGEPFDITLFPVLVFDADDSDWREVPDSCRRELARTVERLVAPREPVGGLVRVLAQVGARRVDEPVHPARRVALGHGRPKRTLDLDRARFQ